MPPSPPPHKPRTIDVSAALVFRDGRLLIAQRPPGGHLAGLWEFPGGKVEPGETWEQCLRRELIEELAVETSVGPLYQEILHEYPGKSVRLRFFLCRILSMAEPQPLGCAGLQWISREQLGAFEFPPADASLLDRLRSDSSVWKVTS